MKTQTSSKKDFNDIVREAALRTAQGEKFHCDLEKRTLRIGADVLVEDGKVSAGWEVDGKKIPDTAEAVRTIEEIYAIYKHSVPSERSESTRKRYFKALPEHELDPDDMIYGEGRDSARAKLETYVLLCILHGCLRWEEFAKGTWFWKSPSDPDLIILRAWL